MVSLAPTESRNCLLAVRKLALLELFELEITQAHARYIARAPRGTNKISSPTFSLIFCNKTARELHAQYHRQSQHLGHAPCLGGTADGAMRLIGLENLRDLPHA